MKPVISIASEEDRSSAISTIILGFSSDPFVRWLCPHGPTYLKFHAAFNAFGGGAIDSGSAFIAEGNRGAALWLPPTVEPDSETFIGEVEKFVVKERQEVLFRILEAFEEYHPDESCWYLPLIAVDPAHQGSGIGSELMKAAMSRIDEDGLPSYLESSNPRNISLYERYGYEVMGQIKIGDAPTIHPMYRPAR
jgi:GNAT superfamily N-acetyltransferase